MRSSLGKTFSAGAMAIVIATAPSFASAGCRHHHRMFSHYGWPDSFAQASSYWSPHGYGCGPFADNEDGWDIGWNGKCYYPSDY
jgi:hypothetical protein